MDTLVIPAAELTPAMLASWHQFQTENSTLRNPFFCPEFTQAAARVRSDIYVGILFNEDKSPIAILPFKKVGASRATAIDLSDYHGMISKADLQVDLPKLIRAWGLKSFEFRYVPTEQFIFQSSCVEQSDSPAIDLRTVGALKKEDRKLRKLSREVGPVRFESHVDDPAVLHQLIEWKRFHCQRTGFADLLKDPWSRDFLADLQQVETSQFAGRLSALYAGDQLVAAHLGLRSTTVWHWWFPSYNFELSKYSPGLLMLLHLIEHARDEGLAEFDFGVGEEGFKQRFATGGIPCGRGRVTANAWQQKVYQAQWRASRRLIQSRIGGTVRSLRHYLRS